MCHESVMLVKTSKFESWKKTNKYLPNDPNMPGFAKGGWRNYQEQMCGSYNLKLSAIAEHIQSKLIHYQQPGKNKP